MTDPPAAVADRDRSAHLIEIDRLIENFDVGRGRAVQHDSDEIFGDSAHLGWQRDPQPGAGPGEKPCAGSLKEPSQRHIHFLGNLRQEPTLDRHLREDKDTTAIKPFGQGTGWTHGTGYRICH
jgi:hypothetical protein